MNYFERKSEDDAAKKKYFLEKTNLRLKYAALSSICISIILLLIMIFCLDYLSPGVLLFLQGCAGLFTIVFVILVAILYYRVNASYFNDRIHKK